MSATITGGSFRYSEERSHLLEGGAWLATVCEKEPTGWDGTGPFYKHYTAQAETQTGALETARAAAEAAGIKASEG